MIGNSAVVGDDLRLTQAMLESIPAPVFYKDENLVYRGCNRAFTAYVGAAPERIIGHTAYDLSPPHLAAIYDRADRELLAAGGSQVYEAQVRYADGSLHDISFHKAVFHKPDGARGGLIGVMLDITARKAAEAELQAQEENLRLLLEATGEGIFTVSPEGRCMLCNASAARMLGYDGAADLIGRDLGALICPECTGAAAERCAEMRAAVREGRRLRVIDGLFRRRDEATFPVECAISPIRRNGEFAGSVVVFSDSTERHKLEAQLFQALKMESLGTLAAGVAHEINTPVQYVGDNLTFIEQSLADIVRALKGVSEILTDCEASCAARQRIDDLLRDCGVDFLIGELPSAIGQAREGVRHIAHIVQSMREFSHPGAKAKSAADVNHLVGNTLIVATNLWKHVAKVETDLAPDLPPLVCHAVDLNQVLLNLLVNAAQAIEAQQRKDLGRICVRTRLVDDAVEIRIADDGPGIPPDIRAKVFDPFFTTKPAGKGTGQGLAISFDIVVHRHGGSITLEESPPEGGAAFVVRLPLAPSD